MAVRNSVLKRIGNQWLHHFEALSFDEAKQLAEKWNNKKD